MNINRYNYEEYFLLYTDNELDAAERQAVKQFVKDNPDLERELSLLTDTTLKPDDNIVFSNKQLLIQPEAQETFIHAENCEQLFVLYSDDELTNDKKADVEQFVYDNPQYQEVFELIQSIKLRPDLSVTFPDKKSLYRQDKSTKPLVFPWWRVAAAAVVLVFAGVLWLNNTPSSRPSTELANTNNFQKKTEGPGKPKDKTAIADAEPPVDSIPDPATSIAPSGNVAHTHTERAGKKPEPRAAGTRSFQKNNVAHTESNMNQDNVKPLIAKTAKEPAKSVNQQVDNTTVTETPNAAVVANGNSQPKLNTKTLTDRPLVEQDVAATNYVTEAVLASSNSDENVRFANIPLDKKSSLRGLFRKASRFIDKTTSLKPGKKSGLAIGNIEIAFQ